MEVSDHAQAGNRIPRKRGVSIEGVLRVIGKQVGCPGIAHIAVEVQMMRDGHTHLQ